jgi:site-specific DNA-methyltransferase (cytosine-N4-specific)
MAQGIPRGQLTLTILKVLDEMGGSAAPKDIYFKVGHRLGLSPEEVEKRDNTGKFSLFKREVRWAKQDLMDQGMIASHQWNLWSLTEDARQKLINCRPGVLVTVFFSHKGDALWGDSLTVAGMLDDKEVMLHLTSPPYPIHVQKEYGGIKPEQYVSWFMPFAEEYYRTLDDLGSLVINLGEVFNKGEPTMSTYIERLVIALEDKLGFRLNGRFYWLNRSKLPTSHWTTRQRNHVKQTIEPCLWFSRTGITKADNRRVLVPYSNSYLEWVEWFKNNGKRVVRPSGHLIKESYCCTDNGGAIPGNVLDIPHKGGNDPYIRACRNKGIAPHPARMPDEVAEWFIKFLTEPNDLVADLFAGSGTVAAASEKLDRRWIIGEKSLQYLRGALLRFSEIQTNDYLLAVAFG